MSCQDGPKNQRASVLTFMMTSLGVTDVLRTTPQNMVPVGFGSVLGKYSSPLLRLNNWKIFLMLREFFQAGR